MILTIQNKSRSKVDLGSKADLGSKIGILLPRKTYTFSITTSELETLAKSLASLTASGVIEWSVVGGGGGSSEDRFAPRYVVGNVPAGQSAVPLDAGGFTYIPDSGNGSGIAAALIAAGMVPGDVWIRPGTYDLGAIGGPAAVMVVPDGVRVSGAGQGVTVILGRTAGDQGIFRLLEDSSISDMKLDVQTSGLIFSGSSSVVHMAGRGRGCLIDRCVFNLSTSLSSLINTCIMAEGGLVRDCDATGTPRGGLLDEQIWTSFLEKGSDANNLTVQNCRVVGFDVSLLSRCTASFSRFIIDNLYSESPAQFGVYQSRTDGASDYVSITDSEFFCGAGVVGVSFGAQSFQEGVGGSLCNSKINSDRDLTNVPAIEIYAGGGGLVRVQGNMIVWTRTPGAAIDIGSGDPSDPCNGNLVQNNQIFNHGTGVEVISSGNRDNMVQNNLIIAAVPVVSASSHTQISGNTP